MEAVIVIIIALVVTLVMTFFILLPERIRLLRALKRSEKAGEPNNLTPAQKDKMMIRMAYGIQKPWLYAIRKSHVRRLKVQVIRWQQSPDRVQWEAEGNRKEDLSLPVNNFLLGISQLFQ